MLAGKPLTSVLCKAHIKCPRGGFGFLAQCGNFLFANKDKLCANVTKIYKNSTYYS